MDVEEFKITLKDNTPPASLRPSLSALWYDAKGDWNKSHDIAQDIRDSEGSWIHAYLHRKEGDEGNASYWYGRAGKPFCKLSLKDEWESIVIALLD
jgi:hypothetical protein